MSEHLDQCGHMLSEQFPIDASVPVAYLLEPDEDGERKQVFIMDTDQLRDSYALRAFNLEDASEGQATPQTTADQFKLYSREMTRLRSCNVAMPWVYGALAEDFVTNPNATIVLAAERVRPMPVDSVDPQALRREAWRTIVGLIDYLQESHDEYRQDADGYYLYDVFMADQFMFGSIGDEPPRFYMINVGANVNNSTDEYAKDSRLLFRMAAIIETADVFGRLATDPKLLEYARAAFPELRDTIYDEDIGDERMEELLAAFGK